MESMAIVVFALTMRWLMKVVKPLWLMEAIRYMGMLLPLILIILEILEKDAVSIVLAGICFFWFPMVSKGKSDDGVGVAHNKNGGAES